MDFVLQLEPESGTKVIFVEDATVPFASLDASIELAGTSASDHETDKTRRN